jgi:hypothetical protein
VLAIAREETPPAQRGSIRVAVSVSTFVPKAHTPFQWEAQLTLSQVQERQRVLREAMPRKGVELHWHDAEVSLVEGVLARGGRDLSRVIERVWRSGGGFDAWTEVFSLARWAEAFEAEGIDPEALAGTPRSLDEPLFWDHICSGVSKEYLALERARAFEGVVTPDCSFGECTACGACPSLGVDIMLAGDSRG